jgi:hypothetical protein
LRHVLAAANTARLREQDYDLVERVTDSMGYW